MKSNIELSGKCTLQFKTSKTGRCKIQIPRVNKDGENCADGLISEVLHFAIMRHGKDEVRRIVAEKLSKYGYEFDDKGIQE